MREKILTDLYQSKELADLLAKMNPESLREDIKQELFVVLCQLPDDVLNSLHEKNQLRFYATRIVLNMVKSTSSPFYYKFRKTITTELPGFAEFISDDSVDPAEEEREYAEKVSAVKKAVSELHWYHREMLERYIEHGSAGKMEQDMRQRLGGICIPKRTITETVRAARKEVRRKVTL